MKKLLLVAVAGLALLASACGSDDDPTLQADGNGSTGASAEAHNEADVMFAQGMIAHHEQAIEMSDMVLERGENAEVKALAEDIKAAQTPEIEILRGWLQEWDEEETPSGDDMGGMPGMDGGEDATMMSDDEMDELEGASGTELDKMFLEMMIRHHEGAISMAETEVEDGEFPDAKDLAQRIIDTQQAEVTKMKELLTKLGG